MGTWIAVTVYACGCVVDPLNGLLVYCAKAGCMKGISSGKNAKALVEPARLIELKED